MKKGILISLIPINFIGYYIYKYRYNNLEKIKNRFELVKYNLNNENLNKYNNIFLVKPNNEREVEKILNYCNKFNLKLIINDKYISEKKINIWNKYIKISFEKMNKISFFNDNIIQVDSGVTVRELVDFLKENEIINSIHPVINSDQNILNYLRLLKPNLFFKDIKYIEYIKCNGEFFNDEYKYFLKRNTNINFDFINNEKLIPLKFYFKIIKDKEKSSIRNNTNFNIKFYKISNNSEEFLNKLQNQNIDINYQKSKNISFLGLNIDNSLNNDDLLDFLISKDFIVYDYQIKLKNKILNHQNKITYERKKYNKFMNKYFDQKNILIN